MALGLLASCLYDADDPCGPNQSLDDALGVCLCEDGYAFSEEGCVACGKNEVSGPAGCGGKSGYQRDSEGACRKAETPPPPSPPPSCEGDAGCEAEGEECESDGGCTGPDPSDTCQSDDDCEDGQSCKTATGVCMSPPEGAGMACEGDEDCASTDATYCDPYFKVCVVQGCSIEPDDCFVGFECCDLSEFGVAQPLCVMEGFCGG